MGEPKMDAKKTVLDLFGAVILSLFALSVRFVLKIADKYGILILLSCDYDVL